MTANLQLDGTYKIYDDAFYQGTVNTIEELRSYERTILAYWDLNKKRICL